MQRLGSRQVNVRAERRFDAAGGRLVHSSAPGWVHSQPHNEESAAN